jgi:hypothetical protein
MHDYNLEFLTEFQIFELYIYFLFPFWYISLDVDNNNYFRDEKISQIKNVSSPTIRLIRYL